MPRRTPLLAAVFAMLAACDDAPLAPGADPLFLATVRGSVQEEFRGTGQFSRGLPDKVDPPEAGPGIGTYIIGAGSSFDPRSFSLHREGTDLPAPGVYPLVASAGGPRRFIAVFTRRQGDTLEGFTSVQGELRITVSTPLLVEGTFRFEGKRNCAGTVSGESRPGATARLDCTHPIDPALPTVEVTGSFVATPGPTSHPTF
jgi:hypothetical protein